MIEKVFNILKNNSKKKDLINSIAILNSNDSIFNKIMKNNCFHKFIRGNFHYNDFNNNNNYHSYFYSGIKSLILNFIITDATDAKFINSFICYQKFIFKFIRNILRQSKI